MDREARPHRYLRCSLRRARPVLSLCAAVTVILLAACGGTAGSAGSPTSSPNSGATTTFSPSPTLPPGGSTTARHVPEWFRAMVMEGSRWWGDPHPKQAWWALTSDEKAKLAGGNPGGDPKKQVYFAILQGEFRGGQYQFISLEADPGTHRRLSFVAGGGFERTSVGPMAAFQPSISLSAKDLSAAKAVVRDLVAAVNDDRFARARSLMVDPDRNWNLDDMKSIRWVRLKHVALLRVEHPNAVWLSTELRRRPPPVAGNPYWPNFMLLVRGPSGTWRVAQTATGP